jgi:hypothetical protein
VYEDTSHLKPGGGAARATSELSQTLGAGRSLSVRDGHAAAVQVVEA